MTKNTGRRSHDMLKYVDVGRVAIVALLGVFLSTTLISGLASAEESVNKSDVPEETYNIKISPYQPNYFGFTVRNSDPDNEGEAVFQISVKFKLVESWDLYFAYTQKSFWSIQKSSEPFRENNFSPEIFYEYKLKEPGNLLSWQFGPYRHESTGEAGVGSYGWNTTYLETRFKFGSIYVTPRLWVPSLFHNFDENASAVDNPDIYRYYGYGHLALSYGDDSDVRHSLLFRMAPIDDTVMWQYRMDIPLQTILNIPFMARREINPDIFLEIRNGYGEGLKSYNVKTSSMVLGITLAKI